jgi:translation initiation factor IF-2
MPNPLLDDEQDQDLQPDDQDDAFSGPGPDDESEENQNETQVEEEQEEEQEEERPRYLSVDELLDMEDEEEEHAPAPAPVPAPAPAPRVVQEVPAPDREKARGELKNKFTQLIAEEKADEAFLLAVEMGAQVAEDRLMRRMAPLQETVLQAEVDRFKAQAEREDPKLFKANSKDFDQFIEQAENRLAENPQMASQLTRKEAREFLGHAYERATGRTFSKVRKNAQKQRPVENLVEDQPKPRREPPNYNAQQRSGPARHKAVTIAPKTAREKELVRMSRIAGLSDAEIVELLTQ